MAKKGGGAGQYGQFVWDLFSGSILLAIPYLRSKMHTIQIFKIFGAVNGLLVNFQFSTLW